MMKPISWSMLVFAALATPLTFGAFSEATSLEETKPPAISVALRADHDRVKAGDPIVLKRTLTNRSDHQVTYERDRYHPGCAVDVVDEQGKFAADKKLGYRRGRLDVQEAARTMTPEQLMESGLLNGSLVLIALKPGESFVESCEVSSFYDMTKPGVYIITAQFEDPESAAKVSSESIRVTVLK